MYILTGNNILLFFIFVQENQDTEEGVESYNSGGEDEEEMKIKGPWEKPTTKPKRIEFISGKRGARYKKYCGFSIQPQNYPNAIQYVSTFFKRVIKILTFKTLKIKILNIRI